MQDCSRLQDALYWLREEKKWVAEATEEVAGNLEQKQPR